MSARALACGAHRAVTSVIIVCCATGGNHGRSVTWDARTFGCNRVIHIHETLSAKRPSLPTARRS